MNPGGDYGNKELSPAFKNRFSEVWCPSLASSEDLLAIVARSLAPGLQDLAERIVKLCTWLRESGAGLTVSVRDVLAWVTFINTVVEGGLAREVGVLQGAHLVWLDGLRVEGVSEVQARDSQAFVKRCKEQLGAGEVEGEEGAYIETRDLVSVGPFSIPRSPGPGDQEQEFSFLAPTTCSNVAKMLRALQISKPLLLEVSPGIGKTSLASWLGHRSQGRCHRGQDQPQRPDRHQRPVRLGPAGGGRSSGPVQLGLRTLLGGHGAGRLDPARQAQPGQPACAQGA